MKNINEMIKLWLEKESNTNFVDYNDLDDVILDGNFDLNDLKDKLLQSIVEEIEIQAQHETLFSHRNGHCKCNWADSLKAKLTINIKE